MSSLYTTITTYSSAPPTKHHMGSHGTTRCSSKILAFNSIHPSLSSMLISTSSGPASTPHQRHRYLIPAANNLQHQRIAFTVTSTIIAIHHCQLSSPAQYYHHSATTTIALIVSFAALHHLTTGIFIQQHNGHYHPTFLHHFYSRHAPHTIPAPPVTHRPHPPVYTPLIGKPSLSSTLVSAGQAF